MSLKLGMIHTIARLAEMYDDLCAELLPGVERFHIADEGLLQMLLAAKRVTPAIYRRFVDDALCAESVGADLILLTCSSISPSVDVARPLISVPLMKIDEPMADRAITLGRRIGVVATADTTLKPTTELIAARGAAAGAGIEIEAALCVGAHRLMLAGDMAAHDDIVLGYLRQMMETQDVIVLAQGSMARVAELIPERERKAPILSSPRLGIQRAKEILDEMRATRSGEAGQNDDHHR